jgi:O-antigen/teichoic acid export membrane protein
VLAGPRAAGLYAVAVAMAQPANQVAQVIGTRALEASGIDEPTRLDGRYIGRAVLVAILLAGIAAFSVVPLFGDEYSSSRAAAIILILATLPNAIALRHIGFKLRTNQQRSVIRGDSYVLATQVLLIVILLPHFGVTGAALASLGSYFLRALLQSFRAN